MKPCQAANEIATTKIAELELPEGGAVRFLPPASRSLYVLVPSLIPSPARRSPAIDTMTISASKIHGNPRPGLVLYFAMPGLQPQIKVAEEICVVVGERPVRRGHCAPTLGPQLV